MNFYVCRLLLGLDTAPAVGAGVRPFGALDQRVAFEKR
jgi:hypothetical protein